MSINHRLAAIGLIALAMAGCRPSPAGTTGHASPTPTGPKLLKGAKLNSLLLPAGAMPKGFRLETDQVRNTGDAVAPRSSEPIAPGKLCQTFVQTAWIRAAGIGSATFAQNDYVDAGHINQFGQELDAFHGDDAQKVMVALRSSLARCTHFTEKSNGMTAKVRIVSSAVHRTADEGFKALITSPAWEGGMTLAAIRVGNTVVTTFCSSSHKDRGAAAVKMAERLAANVRSAS